jgi:hypothetical protein
MQTLKRRRALREQIVALLEAGDFPALTALAGRETGVADRLTSFPFNPEDLLHWRAVEGLGWVAGAQPQQVRKLISRLLYQLNEDSGSFGWLAAAALGEVGRHQLPVVEEILPMFCGFLELEFCRVSMLWGLGRLWEVHPGALPEAVPQLLGLLEDADPQVRGLAAWALGKAGLPEASPALEGLRGDAGPVYLYDQGELRQTAVGELAKESLARITGQE